MKRQLWRIKRKLLGRKDFAHVDGSIIPAPDLRWCGAEFKDDSYYIKSAEGEAKRLIDYFACHTGSSVLDIGCGQGRLAIGLQRILKSCNYLGLDVDVESIKWCQKYIQQNHPTFRFQHIRVNNERYNKKGDTLTDNFQFDAPEKSINIIYLYSVFSHMFDYNMRIYLKEFGRILKPEGHIFFTTFVEENVPDFVNNPDNYGYDKYSSSLNVVRYEKNYLYAILDENGFAVTDFVHRAEAKGQSAIYAKRKV